MASLIPNQDRNSQMYRRYMQNMLNTYRNRQDLRLFTEILLTSGTAIIFILFVIRPTATTIAELYTKMQVKQDTLTTMDNKIKNLQAAETIYRSETQRLSLLNTGVPQIPSPDTFIRQIEGLARKNAVTLTGLTIAEANITNSLTQPQPSPENLQISINVSATYENLKGFLSDLESMRRPISVSSGTTQLGSQLSTSEISFTLTGTTPFLRKPLENSTSQ